jgi:hypothetical protein
MEAASSMGGTLARGVDRTAMSWLATSIPTRPGLQIWSVHHEG